MNTLKRYIAIFSTITLLFLQVQPAIVLANTTPTAMPTTPPLPTTPPVPTAPKVTITPPPLPTTPPVPTAPKVTITPPPFLRHRQILQNPYRLYRSIMLSSRIQHKLPEQLVNHIQRHPMAMSAIRQSIQETQTIQHQ